MDYLLKQKREKIEAEAERLFGNDMLLKTAYVMSQMNSSEEEVKEVSNYLRKAGEDLANEMLSKLEYTYDQSGNVVPVKQDGIEIKISD
jgi:hypothetical protein